MRALSALLVRELRLAVRAGGGAPVGVVFFLAVVTVVPFGVGPDLNLLARIGPAILWLGALLATLLGLDRLFQADLDDGSLDLIHLGPVPLELAVAVKALAHWIATGLPLVVAAPLLGLFVNLPASGIGAVTLTLLVGTPALTFLGTIGAALTVALRRGGLLLSILILPLAIPVLIFGVAAANAAIAGPMPFLPPFLLLCAMTLFSIVLGTVASAWALRFGLE
ncbi:heme exporter protein B [Labrys monachus]|uniref:Heme exporter protein B n=1 Tax=Labrys monachus TaxID=217067 RepID=A0ABU0FP06_9HYPH|nr:heme exporter protein B [Labrys monachus]